MCLQSGRTKAQDHDSLVSELHDVEVHILHQFFTRNLYNDFSSAISNILIINYDIDLL